MPIHRSAFLDYLVGFWYFRISQLNFFSLEGWQPLGRGLHVPSPIQTYCIDYSRIYNGKSSAMINTLAPATHASTPGPGTSSDRNKDLKPNH